MLSKILKKILVIDDEPIVRDTIKLFLETEGYSVITAEDGRDSINKTREHNPSLIITDIVMPNMEGLETIRHYKKTNPNISIMAISGAASFKGDMYLELAGKLGADCAISKPIDRDILLDQVVKLIGHAHETAVG